MPATELAATLSTNTGATSYHLRKLESVGLVADTGEGRASAGSGGPPPTYHSSTNSTFRDDEDTATALDWLQRDYIRQSAEKTERRLDAAPGWPTEWGDALGLGDALVTVAPEQMRELQERLNALLLEFRAVSEGYPGARRISVYSFARPIDPLAAPGEDDQ